MHQEQNPPPERRDIRRSFLGSSSSSSSRPPPPLPPRHLPRRRRETAYASSEYEEGGNDDGGQDGGGCRRNSVTNDDRKDGNGASTPAAAPTGGCSDPVRDGTGGGDGKRQGVDAATTTTTTANPDSMNDSDDGGDSGEGRVVAFADADARFDSCPGSGTARPDPSDVEVRLEYDYELHAPTANTTDVRPVARILEEDMLDALASYLGLSDCRSGRSGDGGRGRRGRRLGAKRGRRSLVAREEYGASHDAARRGLQLREEEKRSITAATSELSDIVDDAHDTCIVPVDLDPVIAAASTCIPMKGSMTTYVRLNATSPSPSAIPSIENGLLHFIQSGMTNNDYVSTYVRKVAFIGTRGEVHRKGPGSSSPDVGRLSSWETGDDGGGLSGLGLGMICAMAAALVICGGLFAKRRRNRRGGKRGGPEEEDDDDTASLEMGGAHQDEGDDGPAVLYRRQKCATTQEEESLEGAEIPGSLAAADALALKPTADELTESDDDGGDDGGCAYDVEYVETITYFG